MNHLAPRKIVGRFLLLFLLSSSIIHAAVPPVTIKAPDPKAWTGGRLPFFIELRAPGSFVGTPTFSIPRIPDTFILKIGTPIISSEQVEDAEWFVQRHEFALFSQQSGELTIPSIPIRFSAREGFSGDAKDFNEKSEPITFKIERPPGSENIGFLVTTSSLEIRESWDPEPQSAEVGSVFKRTISQSASQMTGMALAPAPTQAPEGTRLYPGRAEVSDKTERGSFRGERTETITYLIEKSGTITLPEITFNWWDPEKQKLESLTLPSVSFVVPAPPPSEREKAAETKNRIILSLSFLVLLAVMIWKRKIIVSGARKIWKAIDPPERVAARHFLGACRKNDPAASVSTWNQWQNVVGLGEITDPVLSSEILALQRHVFGSGEAGEWNGSSLAQAFRSYSKTKQHSSSSHSELQPLNPE